MLTDDKQLEEMIHDYADIKYLQYVTLQRRKGEAQHGGDDVSLDWETTIQCNC